MLFAETNEVVATRFHKPYRISDPRWRPQLTAHIDASAQSSFAVSRSSSRMSSDQRCLFESLHQNMQPVYPVGLQTCTIIENSALAR